MPTYQAKWRVRMMNSASLAQGISIALAVGICALLASGWLEREDGSHLVGSAGIRLAVAALGFIPPLIWLWFGIVRPWRQGAAIIMGSREAPSYVMTRSEDPKAFRSAYRCKSVAISLWLLFWLVFLAYYWRALMPSQPPLIETPERPVAALWPGLR